MHKKVLEHIENTLDEIRASYIKAATRIESLKLKEKVPATKLVEELAAEQGKTMAQIYPIMKLLFNNYPNVDVLRGAHGGICRSSVWEDEPLDNGSTDDDVVGQSENDPV